MASFVNDRWKLSNKVHLDIGLRYEAIKHKGSKDRFAPHSANGGLDGNNNTAYDNEELKAVNPESPMDVKKIITVKDWNVILNLFLRLNKTQYFLQRRSHKRQGRDHHRRA